MSNDAVKDRYVSFRIFEPELEMLKSMAKAEGKKNVSQFIRSRVFIQEQKEVVE